MEEMNEVQKFLEEIMERYDTGEEVRKPTPVGVERGYVPPFQIQKMERERQRGIVSSDREWKHKLMKYNLLLSQAKDREATKFLKLQLQKELLKLGLSAEATRLENIYKKEALAEQKRHNRAQEAIAWANVRAKMLNIARNVEGERIPPQWIVEAEQVRSGINVARYFYNILTTSNIFAIGSKREKTRWRDELLNVLRGYEKSDDKFKRSFAQELRPKIEILHLPDGEHTRRFIDKGVPVFTHVGEKYELDFNVNAETKEAVNPWIDLANKFEIDIFGSTSGASIGRINTRRVGETPKKTIPQRIGSFFRSVTGIGGEIMREERYERRTYDLETGKIEPKPVIVKPIIEKEDKDKDKDKRGEGIFRRGLGIAWNVFTYAPDIGISTVVRTLNTLRIPALIRTYTKSISSLRQPGGLEKVREDYERGLRNYEEAKKLIFETAEGRDEFEKLLSVMRDTKSHFYLYAKQGGASSENAERVATAANMVWNAFLLATFVKFFGGACGEDWGWGMGSARAAREITENIGRFRRFTSTLRSMKNEIIKELRGKDLRRIDIKDFPKEHFPKPGTMDDVLKELDELYEGKAYKGLEAKRKKLDEEAKLLKKKAEERKKEIDEVLERKEKLDVESERIIEEGIKRAEAKEVKEIKKEMKEALEEAPKIIKEAKLKEIGELQQNIPKAKFVSDIDNTINKLKGLRTKGTDPESIEINIFTHDLITRLHRAKKKIATRNTPSGEVIVKDKATKNILEEIRDFSPKTPPKKTSKKTPPSIDYKRIKEEEGVLPAAEVSKIYGIDEAYKKIVGTKEWDKFWNRKDLAEVWKDMNYLPDIKVAKEQLKNLTSDEKKRLFLHLNVWDRKTGKFVPVKDIEEKKFYSVVKDFSAKPKILDEVERLQLKDADKIIRIASEAATKLNRTKFKGEKINKDELEEAAEILTKMEKRISDWGDFKLPTGDARNYERIKTEFSHRIDMMRGDQTLRNKLKEIGGEEINKLLELFKK